MDQDGLRAAAGDDVRGFLGLEPGVHRDDHSPGGDHAEGGDEPGRGIGRPDRDPVTLADPELGERPGGTADPVRQFDVTEA
ncbi:hypothetical protein GCM10010409_34650 [Mycolicibacterium diernhoferi]